MGKYVILATFATGLCMTVLASQGMKTDLDTSESQAERQKQVLARQIAESAFEMGMSELRRDYAHWRAQRRNVPYEDGSFDLTAMDTRDGVSLTVKGHFNGETYKVTGVVKEEKKVSGMFNGITAGESVNFNVSGPGCSGGACVSGLDAAGGEDRHGISIPHSRSASRDENDVCAAFDGKVEGRGGGCDVQSRTDATNEWVENKMSHIKAEIEQRVSEGSDDVTVCAGGGSGSSSGSSGTCRLNGNTDRSGLLYVKGHFRFDGQAQWHGPVYVAEGGSIRINGGGGTANINGGLVMEDNTTLDMNGGNRVQYNSEKIEDYFDTFPSTSTVTIRVQDRSEGLVR